MGLTPKTNPRRFLHALKTSPLNVAVYGLWVAGVAVPSSILLGLSPLTVVSVAAAFGLALISPMGRRRSRLGIMTAVFGLSLFVGGAYHSEVSKSNPSPVLQEGFTAMMKRILRRAIADAPVPVLPETGQPVAIRDLPARAAEGEDDVFVIDDFEGSCQDESGATDWVGTIARVDAIGGFRDANIAGGVMVPSDDVSLETIDGPDGRFLQANYRTSALSADVPVWAFRIALKGLGPHLKLQDFDGIFLKARGEGCASVHVTLRDNAAIERSPTLSAVLPLTAQWRAYYIPWRTMQVATFYDYSPVEFQDISLSEESIAALWIFGASDIFHFPEQRTGAIDVDDVALFRSDPIRDGRLALGPGFSGIIPGDRCSVSPHDLLREDKQSFSFLGVVYNDGEWRTDGTISIGESELYIKGRLSIRSNLFRDQLPRIERVLLIFTAERIYDEMGQYLRSDNVKMSTRLTPLGLPIQSYNLFHANADPPNSCNRASAVIRSEEMRADGEISHGDFEATLNIRFLPPGIYRLRLDSIVIPSKRASRVMDHFSHEDVLSLNLDVFSAYMARLQDARPLNMYEELLETFQFSRNYLATIRIGEPKAPQAVWTLLARYTSEGTRGTVASEDRDRFQYGFRNTFQGPLILPRENRQGDLLTYVLEPDFPLSLQDRLPLFGRHLMHGLNFGSPTIYPFDYESGWLHVRLLDPDGEQIDLGEVSFHGASLTGGTTGSDRYRVSFRKYGTYRAEVEGCIDDIFGIRHEARGTYEFHVGNRMTMSTACKPGTPFFVGEKYPPLVEVNPPSPAEVRIDVRYLPFSNPAREVRHSVRGRASRYGYFFPGPGYEPLVFNDPGEYRSELFVSYVDPRGVHWYGGQVGGSVVALPYNDAPVALRGVEFEDRSRRGLFSAAPVDRPYWHDLCVCHEVGTSFFPGDVVYFTGVPEEIGYFEYALESMLKPDRFEPPRGTPAPAREREISETDNRNIRRPESGGDDEGSLPTTYFPETAGQFSYLYLSAIRPGFVALATVNEGEEKELSWRPAFNDFGGQRASGPVGDMPDDVYRFMAGVVIGERKTGAVVYGTYASAAVKLAPGEYEAGTLPPFTKPLFRQAQCDYRLLYGVEAGSILVVGDRLALGGSTVPAVPVRCRWEVTKPSGETIVREGDGNDIGRCAPVEPIMNVDEPGVWRVRATLFAEGIEGYVTGVCDGQFEHYVVEPGAPELIRIQSPPVSRIAPDRPTLIRGRVTERLDSAVVHYTLQFPGTIMDLGELPVGADGTFTYRYDPLSFGVEFQNFDVRDITGKHEAIETVLLSLFLEGTDPSSGAPVYSACKVVMHGPRLIDMAPGRR